MPLIEIDTAQLEEVLNRLQLCDVHGYLLNPEWIVSKILEELETDG